MIFFRDLIISERQNGTMNKNLFNDATMKELLGEAWDKNLPALKNQEETFSFYRQVGQEQKNLGNDKEKRAAGILREAANNPDLLDTITERAAIRWSEGLSDSLFDAVLCNFRTLNESAERDSEGKIILRPCSDCQEKLKLYGGNFNEKTKD